MHELYNRLEKEDIILAFRGDVTDELLDSVFQIMELKLEGSQSDIRLKKKVNHILVECLQNVYHHREEFTTGEKSEIPEGNAMFLICHDKSNRFRIITGNHMLNINIDKLKNEIDSINAMTSEELRSYYLEKLANTTLSEKGGAGLGIIDMARKSGNKLDYRFEQLNDRISFFSLIVLVD